MHFLFKVCSHPSLLRAQILETRVEKPFGHLGGGLSRLSSVNAILLASSRISVCQSKGWEFFPGLI